MACEFVSISGTWLPGVAGIDPAYETIGDRVRTLSGKMREDHITTKRSWTVRLTGLTGAERASVVALITPGAKTVVFDDVGTVSAFARVTNSARVPRRARNEPTDFKGGTLTIEVSEE